MHVRYYTLTARCAIWSRIEEVNIQDRGFHKVKIETGPVDAYYRRHILVLKMAGLCSIPRLVGDVGSSTRKTTM